jgi:hypothetical protein
MLCYDASSAAPDNDDALVKLDFTVEYAADYTVYCYINCPSYTDDSFWMKMDKNGTFQNYNGLVTSGWQWTELINCTLTQGDHTLYVGYREDGALFDKVFITKNSEVPTSIGDGASNCEGTGINDVTEDNNLLVAYPNPFSTSTTIKYQIKEFCNVSLSIYDLNRNISQ